MRKFEPHALCCLPCKLSRQDFLRAALALAASPLLRFVPAEAAEGLEVSEIAPGVFVHQGRYELAVAGKPRRHGQCELRGGD